MASEPPAVSRRRGWRRRSQALEVSSQLSQPHTESARPRRLDPNTARPRSVRSAETAVVTATDDITAERRVHGRPTSCEREQVRAAGQRRPRKGAIDLSGPRIRCVLVRVKLGTDVTAVRVIALAWAAALSGLAALGENIGAPPSVRLSAGMLAPIGLLTYRRLCEARSGSSSVWDTLGRRSRCAFDEWSPLSTRLRTRPPTA
jgi:hypothetical protein